MWNGNDACSSTDQCVAKIIVRRGVVGRKYTEAKEAQRHRGARRETIRTHTHKGGCWNEYRKHAAPRLALARKLGGKTSGGMRGRQAAKDYRLRQSRKTGDKGRYGWRMEARKTQKC